MKMTLKRLERVMTRLSKQIKQNISTVQLKYDMLQFESEEDQPGQTQPLRDLAIDFSSFVENYCINLFAATIPT